MVPKARQSGRGSAGKKSTAIEPMTARSAVAVDVDKWTGRPSSFLAPLGDVVIQLGCALVQGIVRLPIPNYDDGCTARCRSAECRNSGV